MGTSPNQAEAPGTGHGRDLEWRAQPARSPALQGGAGTAGILGEADTFTLIRALTYSTLFIGFFLVFLPGEVLTASGITTPAARGLWQWLGLLVGAGGGGLAVWCILTFALRGRGTPAPFDPPRRLVVLGPYQYLRNPMYLGAGLALGGAALFYQSLALAGYLACFLLVTHLFVLLYEEPTLRHTFGAEYEAYCRRVSRWIPRGSRPA